MKVGEIEVLPVFDGFGYEVARDVLLKPGETDPWARHHERLDARGRLEFTLGGFLVRTGDRTILVDAGAGTIDTGQYKGGQLLTSLEHHGVAPGDVAYCMVELTEPGWEFVFDVDRAAATAARQQITQELLDTQDPAAAAHFPGTQFSRLVRTGQGGQGGQGEKTWIFL